MKHNQELITYFDNYIMDHIDEELVLIPISQVYRDFDKKYSINDIIFLFFTYYLAVGNEVYIDNEERYLIYCI